MNQCLPGTEDARLPVSSDVRQLKVAVRPTQIQQRNRAVDPVTLHLELPPQSFVEVELIMPPSWRDEKTRASLGVGEAVVAGGRHHDGVDAREVLDVLGVVEVVGADDVTRTRGVALQLLVPLFPALLCTQPP